MRGDLNLEDILTDRAAEEDFLEVPLADKVFKRFLLIAGLMVLGIAVQLVYVGGVRHSFYEERAILNMSGVKTEVAPRGIIYDRFQKPLITNESAFDAVLIPGMLPAESVRRIEVIDAVSAMLNLDTAEVRKKIGERDWSLSARLVLKNNISHDELVAITAAELPGIEADSSFERVPYTPFAFSHLIGYTGLVNEQDLSEHRGLVIDDRVGRAGLEAFYDSYLRGIDGEEMIIRDASGKVQDERAVRQAEIGDSVNTYVDRDFQSYFYDRLHETIQGLGRNIGVGIAMNPQNGEVLALFNIPSYQSDSVSESLNAKHEPMFNRAVSGLYSPGSTIKPLVAVGALVEGILDPLHQIYSPGYLDVPNPYDPSNPSRFLDWRPQGWVDMYSAIARSSNVYFYEVGGGFGDQRGLGISGLKKWWQKFGLDQKTGIDLPGEDTGFLPDAEWKEGTKHEPWRLGDTFNVSIGQGDFAVTPIELLNYITAIANGGKLYTPRIVRDIEDQKRTVVLENKESVRIDLSGEAGHAISLVRRGMREAVIQSYGTGYLLHDLPIDVASKTGSAQVSNNTKTNAFFVGFAPYDNPEIAIVILVENAREGSLNVVPVARDVFLWYYQNRIKK